MSRIIIVAAATLLLPLAALAATGPSSDTSAHTVNRSGPTTDEQTTSAGVGSGSGTTFGNGGAYTGATSMGNNVNDGKLGSGSAAGVANRH